MRHLALFLALMACTAELPIPESTISPQARNAPAPRLIPITDITNAAAAQSPAIAAGNALQARAARLKARANLLRGRSVEDGQAALSSAR